MSALLAPGATPSTDAELIRSFHDRIRALETKPTTRVGDWVLSDINGMLTATKPGSSVALTGLAEDVGIDLPIKSLVDTSQLQQAVDSTSGGIITQIAHALTGLVGAGINDLLDWVTKLPFLNLLGLLDIDIIPGLDASKIVSGQFATSMINGLVDLFDNIEDMLQSIPFGGIVGGLVGFWADFVSGLLGLGAPAIPAYTPQNSAIANIQGQINTIQAQISSSGNGVSDGFNDGVLDTTNNWTLIYSNVHVQPEGYIFNPGGAGDRYGCAVWKGGLPQSTKWQVQMTLVLPQTGGGAIFGQHRFGGGADATLSGTYRFPAVEVYVDQFGARVRLGSLTGPVNAFNMASAGWVQYGEVNYGSNLKTGDVLALEVDETNKIYNLYLNPGPASTPIIAFLDSTNTMVRGPTHRYPWVQLNCLNDAFGVGNGWDNFYMFDRVNS